MNQDDRTSLISLLGRLLAGGDLPLDGTRLETSLIDDGLAIRVNRQLRLTPLGLKVLLDLRISLLRAEAERRPTQNETAA